MASIFALGYDLGDATEYTNATAATIQTAHDAFPAGGGDIFLGPGTYTLTSGISFTKKVRLFGAGQNTILTSASTINLLTIGSGADFVEVANLTIQGQMASGVGSGTPQKGIVVSAGTKAVIRHVLFSGTTASVGLHIGVEVDSTASYAWVIDNYFERIRGAASGYGIAVYLNGPKGVLVRGNRIILPTTTDGRHGVLVTNNATYCTIKDNLIEQGAAHHIRVTDDVANATSGIVVQGNTSLNANMSHADASDGGAIEVAGTGTDPGGVASCTVQDNYVQGSSMHGIKVQAAPLCVVAGNTVRATTRHGIFITGAQTNIVSGNTVDGAAVSGTYDGIHLNAWTDSGGAANTCDNTKVIGNAVVGTGATYVYALRISSTNPPTGISVGNNILIPGSTGSFFDGGTSSSLWGVQTAASTFAAQGSFDLTPLSGGTGLRVLGSSHTFQVDSTGTLQVPAAVFSALTGVTWSAAGTNVLQASSATGALEFQTGGSSARHPLFIKSDGTVGINTNAPNSSYKLDLTGDSNFTGNMTVGGTLLSSTLQGNVTVISGTSATPTTDTLFARLAQTGATTVTLFTQTSPASGKLLFITASNNNTTVQSNADQALRGGVNWAMRTGDTLILSSNVGGVANFWVEVGRVPANGWTAFADADTTPSVRGSVTGSDWLASNTGATSITTFDDGVDGQEITILATTNNTTFVDGATLVLASSGNFNIQSTSTIKFKKRSTVWYEISRSVN